MTERKILEQFTATNNIGKEYTVLTCADSFSAFDIHDHADTIERIVFVLESGEPLKEISENEFEIVSSGQRLKKV